MCTFFLASYLDVFGSSVKNVSPSPFSSQPPTELMFWDSYCLSDKDIFGPNKGCHKSSCSAFESIVTVFTKKLCLRGQPSQDSSSSCLKTSKVSCCGFSRSFPCGNLFLSLYLHKRRHYFFFF